MDDLLALMEEDAAADSWDQSPPESSNADNNHHALISPESAAGTSSSSSAHPKNKKQKKQHNQKAITATDSVNAQVDHKLGIRMIHRTVGSLDLLDSIEVSNYHSPASLAAMSLAQLNGQILTEPTNVVDVATVYGNTNMFTVGVVFSNSGTKIAAKGNAFCVLQVGSTLQSGIPAISVLLFGPAYSKHCATALPGMVIALENPRLLPPKQPSAAADGRTYKNNTTLSFSINDEQKLVLVAKARDFGLCQATVKGKNAQGQWISNAKKCGTVIDTTRMGKYCHVHRNFERDQKNKTARAANNKSNNNNNSKGTFMQQQRLEFQQSSLRRDSGALILPDNKGSRAAKIMAPPTRQSVVPSSSRLQGVPMQMSKIKTNNINNNRILNPPSQQQQQSHQPRADGLNRPTTNLHPSASKKLSTNTLLNPALNKSNTASVSNPYRGDNQTQRSLQNPYNTNTSTATSQSSRTMNYGAKRQPLVPKTNDGGQPSSKKRSATPSSREQDPLDWLLSSGRKKKNKASATAANTDTGTSPGRSTSCRKSGSKAHHRLNTAAMGGFDGTVPVPKPARMFAATAGTTSRGHPSTTSNLSNMQRRREEQEAAKEAVLAKQRQVAEQLKASKNTSSSSNNNTATAEKTTKMNTNNKNKLKTAAIATKSSSGGDFFDSDLFQTNDISTGKQDLDYDTLLNAKSRFATEANAEAYLTSRQKVMELEEQERKKEQAAKKKKMNQSSDGVIEQQWTCITCNNKVCKNKPLACIKSGHKVIHKRILNKKDEAITEKRMKLNSQAAADAQDGGLVFGSGLEWSRCPSSRFS
jgi:hypothetical protein